MKIRIRNISHTPTLEREGTFICPMPSPPLPPEGDVWYSQLSPHDRLYYHQTLASVRWAKRFSATSKIPRDSLDFQLQSRYNHSREIFPEKIDSVLQRETCLERGTNKSTFRTLRNTKLINILDQEDLGHPLQFGKLFSVALVEAEIMTICLFSAGGIKEKMSPHSVKLINSGPHAQLVNNGFSRQPADGNFFRY